MEKETIKKIGEVTAKLSLVSHLAAENEREAKELLKVILREQEGMELPLCKVDEDGCYYEDDCWLVCPNGGGTADVRGIKVWLRQTTTTEMEIIVKVVDDNGGEYDENIFTLLDNPATEIIYYLNECGVI